MNFHARTAEPGADARHLACALGLRTWLAHLARESAEAVAFQKLGEGCVALAASSDGCRIGAPSRSRRTSERFRDHHVYRREGMQVRSRSNIPEATPPKDVTTAQRASAFLGLRLQNALRCLHLKWRICNENGNLAATGQRGISAGEATGIERIKSARFSDFARRAGSSPRFGGMNY